MWYFPKRQAILQKNTMKPVKDMDLEKEYLDMLAKYIDISKAVIVFIILLESVKQLMLFICVYDTFECFLVNSFLSKSNSWGNYNEIFTTTKDKSLNNNSETKKVEFGHVKKLSSRFFCADDNQCYSFFDCV